MLDNYVPESMIKWSMALEEHDKRSNAFFLASLPGSSTYGYFVLRKH